MPDAPEPPLTFYHSPQSTSDITAFILSELEYNAAPLAKRITLNLHAGDARTPTYLSTINPAGKVPAIVHNGTSIWESVAITLYLAEVFGEAKGLYPALGPARGEAMKWIVWSNANITAHLAKVMGFAWCPPDVSAEEKKVREGAADKAKGDLKGHLAVLETGLKGRTYLVEEKYSLADTHVWCWVNMMKLLGVDLAPFGKVVQWLDRVAKRPALAMGEAQKAEAS